jgi:hypothetical protein
MNLVFKIVIYCTLIFSSGLLTAQNNKEKKEFKKAMLQLIEDWQEVPTDFQEYEQAGTFVPESGIRGKYYLNKKMLNLAKIAQLIGEPVFVSGPHKTDMDYSSGSFGHYNPKFLKKLEAHLKILLADKKFMKKAQPFYEAKLKKYMHSYWFAYYNVVKVPETQKGALKLYETAIKHDPSGASFTLQEYFREYTETYQNMGYDWYETNTTVLFWLRRMMDGTDKEFSALMSLVMERFDKKFVSIID